MLVVCIYDAVYQVIGQPYSSGRMESRQKRIDKEEEKDKKVIGG